METYGRAQPRLFYPFSQSRRPAGALPFPVATGVAPRAPLSVVRAERVPRLRRRVGSDGRGGAAQNVQVRDHAQLVARRPGSGDQEQDKVDQCSSQREEVGRLRKATLAVLCDVVLSARFTHQSAGVACRVQIPLWQILFRFWNGIR